MLQILLIIIFYAEQHLLNSDADQVNYLFRPATQPSSGLFKLKRGIFTVFKLFSRSVLETKAVKTYPTSCILDSKYFCAFVALDEKKKVVFLDSQFVFVCLCLLCLIFAICPWSLFKIWILSAFVPGYVDIAITALVWGVAVCVIAMRNIYLWTSCPDRDKCNAGPRNQMQHGKSTVIQLKD